MIGGLVAVAIAIWFYRTAIQIHDPKPFLWVANSVVAYYVVVFLWWFLVIKPVSATFHHLSQFNVLILTVELAGYALAVLVVWFIRKRWMASAASKAP
ncbi:hypothetical protein JCM13664_17120 [Methylothermus subterraneus]|nr:hypothetical protein HGMM_F27F06C29 [uncultured Gammaproteobacteria bacterium]